MTSCDLKIFANQTHFQSLCYVLVFLPQRRLKGYSTIDERASEIINSADLEFLESAVG